MRTKSASACAAPLSLIASPVSRTLYFFQPLTDGGRRTDAN
ncbi:hypothetical protein PV381_01795 [Streptomyces scabiei]|nr:hypothetical protein [Streptomyces scabiei]MDX2625330.1 hypothetical protein [Streptomyces scabiei]